MGIQRSDLIIGMLFLLLMTSITIIFLGTRKPAATNLKPPRDHEVAKEVRKTSQHIVTATNHLSHKHDNHGLATESVDMASQENAWRKISPPERKIANSSSESKFAEVAGVTPETDDMKESGTLPDKPGTQENTGMMVIANPTAQQQDTYARLMERLDDPAFTWSLNMTELVDMPDMRTLPAPLRLLILSKAVEKFNRGEINQETFLQDTYEPVQPESSNP